MSISCLHIYNALFQCCASLLEFLPHFSCPPSPPDGRGASICNIPVSTVIPWKLWQISNTGWFIPAWITKPNGHLRRGSRWKKSGGRAAKVFIFVFDNVEGCYYPPPKMSCLIRSMSWMWAHVVRVIETTFSKPGLRRKDSKCTSSILLLTSLTLTKTLLLLLFSICKGT